MSALLLHGGLLADGRADVPARPADLLVRDGRVAEVAAPGALAGADAEAVDCTGTVVAPGFVDVHTHSDLTRLVYPRAESRVHQGVSTEVTGNCGLSPAPVGDDEAALRATIGPVDLVPALRFDWSTVDGYLERLGAAPSAINTVPLVGHGSIRQALLGPARAGGAADAAERAVLRQTAEAALDAGVWGLSYGLMYAPGELADATELTELADATTRRGGLLAAHVRAYDGPRLLDAVDEFLAFAGGEDGARLQVSHLRSIGAQARGVPERALARLDDARARGLDVAADAYPYMAGHTTILQLFPPPLRAAGAAAILAAVREDPAAAARAMAACGFGPEAITIAKTGDAPTAATGRTLAELADAGGAGGGAGRDGARAGDPWAAAVALVDAHDGAVDVIVVGSLAEDVEATLRHPLVSIGSDGATLDCCHAVNVPHPRSFGTFPRALRWLLDAGVPLEVAIAKATSEPAARVGLRDRGVLAPGMVADVAVLEPDALADRATYADPLAPAAGVRDLLVAGRPVLRDGAITDERPGRLLLKEAP